MFPLFTVHSQCNYLYFCYVIFSISVLKDYGSDARGATYMQDDFSDHFFLIFEIIIFCFVVAICDLVHAVEAI